MKNTDIKEVRFNNDEVVALYKGHNLIYSKKSKNRIAGSFSEPGEYIIKYNKWYDVPLTLNDDLSFSIELEDWGDCSKMFEGLDKLISVTSLPDTSSVTYFKDMFHGCSSLTYLDLSGLDSSNCHYIDSMFADCTNLSVLIVDFDFNMLYYASYAFGGCVSLTTVSGSIRNLKINIDLSPAPLTNASAMIFINGIVDVPNTRTITFKSTTYNTLTDEQIALATSRGWSIISA